MNERKGSRRSTSTKEGEEKEEKEDELLERRSTAFSDSKSKVSDTIRKKLVNAFHSPCLKGRTHPDAPFHPFLCRLYESDGFCVTSADSLINAGFASVALALITFFRPTPFFLLTIMLQLDMDSEVEVLNKAFLLFILWFWLAVIFTVLVFLGLLLTVSRYIRKRNVLLLHPWGLLLMYLDVFVWLTLTITVHAEIENWRNFGPAFLAKMEYHFVFFLLIYFEVICFALLYYLYATFFITAELTIIEKFFPGKGSTDTQNQENHESTPTSGRSKYPPGLRFLHHATWWLNVKVSALSDGS